MAYAICINVFFFLCEIFVAFYSQIPEHMDHIKYLFVGSARPQGALVPWMWTSMGLMVIGIILTRQPGHAQATKPPWPWPASLVIVGTWIDKGLGMISGGFVPNPLHEVNEYAPTMPEIVITLGVYAVGALVLTVLYKMAISVKEEVAG